MPIQYTYIHMYIQICIWLVYMLQKSAIIILQQLRGPSAGQSKRSNSSTQSTLHSYLCMYIHVCICQYKHLSIYIHICICIYIASVNLCLQPAGRSQNTHTGSEQIWTERWMTLLLLNVGIIATYCAHFSCCCCCFCSCLCLCLLLILVNFAFGANFRMNAQWITNFVCYRRTEERTSLHNMEEYSERNRGSEGKK